QDGSIEQVGFHAEDDAPPELLVNLATEEHANAETMPSGDLLQADASLSDVSIDLSDTYIVATVNGIPVFASDILEPHLPRLKTFEGQYSAEDIAKLRQEIIRRELPRHVERAMLISALKEMLKPDQAKSFEAYLDQEFENQLKRIRQEVGAESKQELERILAEQGTSTENLKTSFRNQQMAQQFLAMKSQIKKEIGRAQLLEYYNAHREDYANPSRVKWKVIIIPFAKAGGRAEALSRIQQASEDLAAGIPFEEVARKYSSGVTAAKGGDWGDWTTVGSLTDEKLEATLFEIPIGAVSEPYESESDYRLVKVVERQQAGYRPFEDLQDEIEKQLNQQQAQELQAKVVEELREHAHIETIFDLPGKPFLSMIPAETKP
ncbi:MAG: peptidylprolyl isomerase, partial [Planctomycetaceae bacterium]